MIRLKSSEFETFNRKNTTLKKVKYYSIVATVFETALTIVSQTIMEFEGQNIGTDMSL